MRFLELILRAYGPFTDFEIDLSNGNHGLHLLYGPNEAGKTSTLRAIRVLLHGFDHKTSDDFVHAKGDLRVGARMRRSDGKELVCFRRKGRKNTLLDADGAPLDEALMTPFISGVTADLMSNAFALCHQNLVEGGKALVEGHGAVGESLFAAGLGAGKLRELLRALEEESSGLFRPRGQKHQTINAALAQFREQKKLVKDRSLKGREWQELQTSFEKTKKKLVELSREIAQIAADRSRVERLIRNAPRTVERRRLLDALVDLGTLPEIDVEQFTERRLAATAAHHAALEAEKQARQRSEELRQQIEELAPPEAVLEQGESIDALYQRSGSVEKAKTDRSQLVGMRSGHRESLRAIARDLWPGESLDDIDERLASVEARSHVRELSPKHKGFLDSFRSTSDDIKKMGEEHEDAVAARDALPAMLDIESLRRALDAARRGSEVESELSRLEKEERKSSEEAQLELERLGLWQDSLDALQRTAIPEETTLERFAEELEQLERESSRLDTEKAELGSERDSLESALAAIEIGGEVPSEDELSDVRERREAAWKLVRRSWLDGEYVSEKAQELAPGLQLAEGFEGFVVRADEVADRLRREAQTVAKHAQLTTSRLQIVEKLKEIDHRRKELEDRREEWNSRWRRTWNEVGVEPLPTPREMRSWSTKRNALLETTRQVREQQASIKRTRGELLELRMKVTNALEVAEQAPSTDEPLSDVVARVTKTLHEQEQNEKARRNLEAQIVQLERSLRRSRKKLVDQEAALLDWQENWKTAVAALGMMEESPSPETAEAVLGRHDMLAEHLREISTFEKRIKGIDRDAEVFRRDLEALLQRVAPDLLEQPLEQAIAQLHSQLSRAREDVATLVQLRKQLEEQEEVGRQALRTKGEKERELADLCHEAGGVTEEELPALEQRVRRAEELRQQLSTVEQTIVEDGGGATLADLTKEIEEADVDALPARQEELNARLASLEERRSELNQILGGERTALHKMDGSGEAAEAAAVAQSLVAKIRDDAERYIRLKLAHTVLRREMERYRRENQGPLLQRASEVFRRITLESFSGLQADFDDNDDPVLRAVRAGSGEKLFVHELSDGTQDQLYLALRLASVERYVERNEPIPLVFDDILILFDDDRACETLKVLAEISDKTQVLFFTHHQRLSELAGTLESPEKVFLHTLSCG